MTDKANVNFLYESALSHKKLNTFTELSSSIYDKLL